MPGLPASNTSSPPASSRASGREAVAGMGYRLAAGGLAGRLRAGDGGVGPCIEDAWVRQVARLWLDVTRAARLRVPAAQAAQAVAQARDGVVAHARRLPVFAVGQATAALALAAIGTTTFHYWQKSHAAERAAVLRPSPVASAVAPMAASRVIAQAQLQPPAPVSVPALASDFAPAVVSADPPPPQDDSASDVQAPPRARPAAPPRALRSQFAMATLRALPAPPHVAPPPRIFTVLATRPLARPHRVNHAAVTQIDMPHWLTEPPRGPMIMSEPPHDLALPPQYASPQTLRPPPLLALPHVDRFAAGTYVPPMMPGAYVYR